MFYLTELETETKIPEHIIYKYFIDNNIHIGAYFYGTKFLGFGVTDKIGENYMNNLKGIK